MKNKTLSRTSADTSIYNEVQNVQTNWKKKTFWILEDATQGNKEEHFQQPARKTTAK